jgi:hypothetical protein
MLRYTTAVGTTDTRLVARVGDKTKHSLKTTELLVLIATMAGILIAAQMGDSIDARWAWLLVSAVSIGYLLSRGLAKADRHADGD